MSHRYDGGGNGCRGLLLAVPAGLLLWALIIGAVSRL